MKTYGGVKAHFFAFFTSTTDVGD